MGNGVIFRFLGRPSGLAPARATHKNARSVYRLKRPFPRACAVVAGAAECDGISPEFRSFATSTHRRARGDCQKISVPQVLARRSVFLVLVLGKFPGRRMDFLRFRHEAAEQHRRFSDGQHSLGNVIVVVILGYLSRSKHSRAPFPI